jgi:hypothetical protein
LLCCFDESSFRKIYAETVFISSSQPPVTNRSPGTNPAPTNKEKTNVNEKQLNLERLRFEAKEARNPHKKKLRSCKRCGKGFPGSALGRPALYCRPCRTITLKEMMKAGKERYQARQSNPVERELTDERREHKQRERYYGRK